MALLLFSCMTFCVAKEVYDPHVGVQVDIFCKSLFALGEECDLFDDIFSFDIVTEDVQAFFEIMLSEQVYGYSSGRAPPFPRLGTRFNS
jgi:hypothetical protein